MLRRFRSVNKMILSGTVLIVLVLGMLMTGCSAVIRISPEGQGVQSVQTDDADQAVADTGTNEDSPEVQTNTQKKEADAPKKKSSEPQKTEYEIKQASITEDGIYHDLESVVLYYDKFGKLPSNFVTKKQAKSLGWESGDLDPYIKGGRIGGDKFKNLEKLLPSGDGIEYIECDIRPDGAPRGAERLVISNNGNYYYTQDHYETFKEVSIVDGKVVIGN